MKIALSHAHSQQLQGVAIKLNDSTVTEWVLSKKVNLLLAELLKKNGHEVEIFDPQEKNYRLHLRKTITEINQYAPSIAIECHFNGSKSPQANGFEVLYYADFEKGRVLAQCIFNELGNQTPIKARGLVPRRDIAFLKYVKCPAVIIEPGFMTNPKDFEYLVTDKSRDDIASATTIAILKYNQA